MIVCVIMLVVIFLKSKLQFILKKMDKIGYGFVDNDKNIYPDDINDWDSNFGSLYYLQSPAELVKNGYGVCWDQVELERLLLSDNNINLKSYFMIAYDNKIEPTHTFIVIESDKYYWLEHAWRLYKGVHEYDSLDCLLNDVKNKFKKSIKKQKVEECPIVIYEYDKPEYGLGCIEFMEHCEKGKKIIL